MSAYSSQEYPLDRCKEDFKNILKGTKREGIEKLLKYIEQKTDFYTAPMVTANGEDIREGALLRYSLTVYSRLMMAFSQENMLQEEGRRCKDEAELKRVCDSIAIIGLLHGLFMANYYQRVTCQTLNPDTAAFEEVTSVKLRDDILGYGKGEETVYILSGFLKLSRDEAFAIRFHSEDLTDANTERVFRRSPLALMLRIAILQTIYLDKH